MRGRAAEGGGPYKDTPVSSPPHRFTICVVGPAV